MREKKELEWTVLYRLVREGFSEEVTFEQRPEYSDIRTLHLERLASLTSFSGLNLKCLKKIIKLKVEENNSVLIDF